MNANKKSKTVKNLTTSGICLALCLFLPFLTGQIQQIGNALSPMHIPVLICGFLCGPYYAAVVGLLAPLLRFMLFGMPPLIPIGAAMCIELAVYGIISGVLYKVFPKRIPFIYVSLITAMLLGRITWGIVSVLIIGISGMPFTFEIFISNAFIKAIPGIIVHIALIPVIVMALRKNYST